MPLIAATPDNPCLRDSVLDKGSDESIIAP